MKTRKVFIKYIVLKNLPFNTIEEIDLEDMLRKSSHPIFKKFSQQTYQHDIIRYYIIEKNI